MNKNKYFFDDLDQDWSKVIVDIYKSSRSSLYIDNTLNLYINADLSSQKIIKSSDNYIEEYITNDKKYKLTFEYEKSEEILNDRYSLNISVSDANYYIVSNIIISVHYFNLSEITHHTIITNDKNKVTLNKFFVNSFIDRAIEFIHTDKQFIDKLKNAITSEVDVI